MTQPHCFIYMQLNIQNCKFYDFKYQEPMVQITLYLTMSLRGQLVKFNLIQCYFIWKNERELFCSLKVSYIFPANILVFL